MAEPIIQRFGEDITLYCADCRDVLPIPADSVITDPPYGVGLKNKRNIVKTKQDKNDPLFINMRFFDDSNQTFLKEILSIAKQIISHYDSTIILCSHEGIYNYPKAESIGCIFDSGSTSVCKWGFVSFGAILYYGKDPYQRAGKGGRPNGLHRLYGNKEKNGHPCPKPLKTMEWLVNRGSLPGMTVLDPFMGSGTTGVACLRTGRKFVGIEISKQYFDIACERIERELKQKTLFPAKPIMKEQQALI